MVRPKPPPQSPSPIINQQFGITRQLCDGLNLTPLLEEEKIVLVTAVAVPKDWAEAWQTEQERDVNEPRELDEAPSALGGLMRRDGR